MLTENTITKLREMRLGTMADAFNAQLTDSNIADLSFSVSAKWISFFSAYAKKNKISVQYFDTEDLSLKETEMYISGFKAKLKKDTGYKGL